MARLLTRSQFARRSKYSRARISQLVKTGIIILKNGKVDPVQAEAAIAANIERSCRLKSEAKSKHRQSPQLELIPNGFNNTNQSDHHAEGFNNGGGNGTPSLTDARRDHELLKIKLTETQLKIRRGELVSKGEAAKWLMATVSAAKLAFLSLPRRLAGILKTLTDEKEIELLLKSEIEGIISHLKEAQNAKHNRSRPKSPNRSLGSHVEASR
jgi:hypothetical protein